MIEINLLPPEYRTVERTPVLGFLGIFAALASLAAMGYFLTVMMSDTSVMKEELKRVQQDLTNKRAAAAKVNELVQKKKEAEERLNYITAIAERRMQWGLKLKQFQRILDESREMWVTSLSITSTGGVYKFSGQLLIKRPEGEEFEAYTRAMDYFHNDLDFIYHFESSPAPSLQVIPKPGMVPPAILTTPFSFSTKPL